MKRAAAEAARFENLLAAQTVGGDNRAVPLHVDVAHVVEQATPTTDQLEETTTAVMVTLVHL